MILKPRWNPKNKFCVLRLHYSVDPDKNTPEWVENAKRGTTDRSWRREYEIDYDTFDGKPVFPEFDQNLHIGTFDYSPMPIIYVYRAWDFGYHHPAVTIGWRNDKDQMLIRREILGKDIGIKDFALQVKNICATEFPNAKWLDACDPAGHQKNDKSEVTSVEVLNSLGIFPTSKPSNIAEKLETLRQRLRRRNDGLPGVIIHQECTWLINGFKGGYRYAEQPTGSPLKEEPLKDNVYDNIFDSLEYLFTNFLELVPQRASGEVIESSENSIMRGRSSSLNEYF